MKKYTFVSVSPKVKDIVQGELVEHRSIIADHAKQGYPRAYDLVFEIDE